MLNFSQRYKEGSDWHKSLYIYIDRYIICLNSPEREKVVNVNETNTWFETIIID